METKNPALPGFLSEGKFERQDNDCQQDNQGGRQIENCRVPSFLYSQFYCIQGVVVDAV